MITELEVKEIMQKYNLNYSEQFMEFALKFNDLKLVDEFCKYYLSRSLGGGDLGNFLMQNYKGKLGDKQ